jgi:hypothetical protein
MERMSNYIASNFLGRHFVTEVLKIICKYVMYAAAA